MESANLCTCKEHLAMASIPKQEWCEPYDYCTALKEGSLFPCLNLPFYKAPAWKSNCKPWSKTLNPAQKDRESMMSNLAEISFAINDLTLYLDTHPDCPNGTALFYELLEKRLSLLTEFSEKFYPLTQTSMVAGDFDKSQYSWSEGPMPWEGACI